MTAKSLLIVGALGLSSFAFAGTKSYDIILSSPTMAGTTELKPGDYKLKVEGSQAVFTQNSKSWTAPVKIENSDKKFEQTTIESSSKGDMDTIQAIDLGGSNIKLEFGQ
jgi:hypothetical protein